MVLDYFSNPVEAFRDMSANEKSQGNHIMSKSETNFVHLKRRNTFLNIDSGRETYVME